MVRKTLFEFFLAININKLRFQGDKKGEGEVDPRDGFPDRAE